MQLGFLVLADSSEAHNGKLYTLGAGWNVLRFQGLPTTHGFGIGAGIDVAWDEANTRHALALFVEGPDGERLGDEPFRFDFEPGRPPGSVQGQEQRIVFSLGAQVTFETTGPHAVIVEVDGDEIGRSRFYVVVPG
jgi:uncharacterized protein DUF6941